MVVGPRGRRRAHAAAGDPRDPRHRASTRSAVRKVDRGARRRRPVGPPRPARHAPPGRRARPDARRSCSSLGLPVPPRPVQRPGRDDPARRRCPSREAYDIARSASSARASSRRSSLAVRTTGDATTPTTSAALYDYSRRLAADPRVSRVASIVDVDPRLDARAVPAPLRAPGGPADRFVADGAGAHHEGRPDRLHASYTRYGPNDDEARALVRDLRDPAVPLAPPAGVSVLVGGGAADVDDVVDRVVAGLPAHGRCSSSSPRTSSCSCCCARSSCRSRRWSMNTLSIVASFGALVWIFQDGNLSALARLRAAGLRGDHACP